MAGSGLYGFASADPAQSRLYGFALTPQVAVPEKVRESQEFLANGTFTALTKSDGAILNAAGKVDVWVTACGGGGGGGSDSTPTAYGRSAQGGQAGDYCVRYKVELDPGEDVTVTIGAGGGNGGATSFGSHLTLSGGAKGANGDTVLAWHPNNPSGAGLVISGTAQEEDAVYEGAYGGAGAVGGDRTAVFSRAGGNNGLGIGLGGVRASWGGGGGGGGLRGSGGNTTQGAGQSAAANSGAGGSGGGYNGGPGGSGGSGYLKVEYDRKA